MGTVFGRTNLTLNLDLTTLLSIPGATIFANALFQTGSNLATTYVGAYDLTSSIAGTHSIRTNEYYWQQKLVASKVTIRAGQIAAGTEFANQAIGFDDQASAFKTWINNSLASGLPTVVEAYLPVPVTGKPGIVVLLDPNKHIFLKASLSSGSHGMFEGDPNGIRFDLRNAPMSSLSLGWKTADETRPHPGVYKLGLLHNYGYFHRYGSHALTHGNDVPFANVGQAVWRARKPDGTFSHRGIDLQLSVAGAPRVLNKSDFETGDGLRFVGLVPHRPSDIAAVGVLYTHFSRDWSNDLHARATVGRASQTNLEVGYKIVFTRWFSLWPDFQYVWKLSGDRRLADASIFGMRIVFDH